MTTHHVSFYRNTAEGGHRAVCTCGWSASGELEYLQGRSATHDLDDLRSNVEPLTLKSGLPDDNR